MSDSKINNLVAKYAPKFNKARAYKKRVREQEDREAKKEILKAKQGKLEEDDERHIE